MSTQIPQIDHQDLAISRLIVQFRESENLVGYIRALLQEGNDLEQVFQDILTKRSLDTAEGAQLDIIGEIVGRPRTSEDSIAIPFFGFQYAIGSDTFSSAGTPSAGSVFLSTGTDEYINQVLNDSAYRTLIKAKILQNKTKTTINDTIEIVLQGINASGVQITEGDKKFTVNLTSAITDTEKLLLVKTDYISKPAGVSVNFTDADGPFA